MDELKDGELMDEPIDKTDDVRGYKVDVGNDWYLRHYLYCHRLQMIYIFIHGCCCMLGGPYNYVRKSLLHGRTRSGRGRRTYRWRKTEDPVMEH